MRPVLFTLGPILISSFGFFLILALLTAIFVIWRVARVYELDEEKILDLIIMTFFLGLFGSRIYFVATHWILFGNISRAVLITKYPGLSLFGGLILGSLTLNILTRRAKLSFWQIADFGAVGAALALSIGDIGCLLAGCNYGLVSSSIVAVTVIGVVGRRVPLAAFESLMFLAIFLYLWQGVVKFHFMGKVATLFMISFGLVKFFLGFIRGDQEPSDQILAILIALLGLIFFYLQAKRNFLVDLKSISILPFSQKRRERLLLYLKKSWYNTKVDLKIKLGRIPWFFIFLSKKIRKKLNVQSTPTNFS